MFFIYKVKFEYDNGASYDIYTEFIASPDPLNKEQIKSILYQKYNDYDGIIRWINIMNKWDSTSEFDVATIL